MRMLRTAVLMAGLVLSAAASQSPAQGEVSFKLSDRQLDCVRTNAQVYRSVNKDPLFIALNECPRLPQGQSLGAFLSGGPSSIRVIKDTAASDTFIYVTKAQFECLVAARIPGKARLYRFYPNECRLEPVP